MSYFMFAALPTQIGTVLTRLQFPSGVTSPFRDRNWDQTPATIFSELHFGNEGFGCPDGAVYLGGEDPAMLFLETKLNETYAESCRRGAYNSTIRGQLELRWRMASLHRPDLHLISDGVACIRESAEYKAVYQADDGFYAHEDRQDESRLGSWRRLLVDGGVKEFLDLLSTCEDRVYFCAITRDEHNPFDTVAKELLPRCLNEQWADCRSRFCWLPVSDLVKTCGNHSASIPGM